MSAVSVVLPVYNGERHLGAVLDAILAQETEGPLEVIVVDDGSTDGSRRIVEERGERLRLVDGPGRGAPAAINAGVREATHGLICQLDQDVVVLPGYLAALLAALDGEDVAAVQAHYTVDPGDGVWVRVSGLDLSQRYARIPDGDVDHVCTGNTLYRADALKNVGLFDEDMGYGYDNDMSYRLGEAGYRLVFCRGARSVHRMAPGLRPYFRRQHGYGYGRLDLIAKHPGRLGGDQVSGPSMILHAPGTLLALAGLAVAAGLAGAGQPWALEVAAVSGALLALLVVERLVAGLLAAKRFGDSAGAFFVVAHFVRGLAWSWAILSWTTRRVFRRPGRPQHSMPR